MSGKARLLAFGSAFVLLLAAGYVWATYSYYSKGLQDSGSRTAQAAPQRDWGQRGERPAPPSPEERQQRFQQIERDLNLTEDQRRQFAEMTAQAFSGDNPQPGQFREQMEQILTPEQREQVRQNFGGGGFGRGEGMGGGGGIERFQERMAQRDQEARQTLSPRDYEIYQQRMQERRDRMRERMDAWTRGEGGPGGPRGEGRQ